jgi:hypothetical protein
VRALQRVSCLVVPSQYHDGVDVQLESTFTVDNGQDSTHVPRKRTMTLVLVRPGAELEHIADTTASANLATEIDLDAFVEDRRVRLRRFVEELVSDYGGALDRLAVE